MPFDPSSLFKAEKKAFDAFGGSPFLSDGSYSGDYLDIVRAAKEAAGELQSFITSGGATSPQTAIRNTGELGEPLPSLADPTDRPYELSAGGLIYPKDLEGVDYAGGYVTFYINVNEDSYLAKGAELPTSTAPRSANESFSQGQLQTVGAVGGFIAANKAVSEITSGAPLDPRAQTVINGLGGAAGAATAVAGINKLLPDGKAKSLKRMVGAIMLHMPTDLSIRYSASWEQDNQAGMNALVNDKNLTNAGAAYLTGLALQTAPGAFVGKAAGVASNPKKEQLFRNVDFREFTFSYQFFARDSGEWANIQEIIKTFKLHMHPEFKPDTENFLYIYPSEFEIEYSSPAVHKHTACVLTNMSVNYTPNNVWSTFSDKNPTQVNIQLTFKELALLTKQDIEAGY